MHEKFINSNDGILETALQSRERDYHTPQIIEMYEVDGKWIGMVHDAQESVIPSGYFGVAHSFRGKSAHIIIISNDPRVSWDIALKFAASIASGDYSYRRIDLSPLKGFYNIAKSNKKGAKR